MTILRENCPVALCSDHAGYATKQHIIEHLKSLGVAYKDFGTYNEDSCDYPDFAHPCAEAVERGECYPGIAVCGSGEGISITLNKHQRCQRPCLARTLHHRRRSHCDGRHLLIHSL